MPQPSSSQTPTPSWPCCPNGSTITVRFTRTPGSSTAHHASSCASVPKPNRRLSGETGATPSRRYSGRLNDRKWAPVDGRFRPETGAGNGTADMKPLDFIYAKFANKSHLLIRFHPFDQDLMAAIPDQGDNVLQHRLPPRVTAIVEKRAVNLHHV